MKRQFFLFLFAALFSVNVLAQAADYDALANKVKGGDMTVDFKALRFAFADKTPSEARAADPKLQAQMLQLLNEKKFKDVIKIAEGIHKTTFVDMNSHIMASMAYQGLQDPKKAKYHEAVYLGLVNSILKDGDGNTPKTAYQVISIAEEFPLLNALELKHGTQTVESVDGHTYHLQAASDKATNEAVKIYFNIDKVGLKMAAVPAK
ncbi:MAG: DUF4919 domain-containing protein [Pyrinomonadaceae bacterium]